MYKLVLINNEETCSQSNNNFEQESICSVNISEGDKCLSLSDQLFNVKEIIVQSDREKGTAKGQEMLQLIISQGMASFQVKSLIKRRTVNYLIRNYSNYPPRHVKKNLAECISSQLFGHLAEQQQIDIKIDQDFERLNPGKSEIMLRKWPSIAKQICEFAERSQTKAIAESGIKKMFSTLSL
ncbi:hypothetical protein Fcan01_17838, partial [Folsomia candida]